MRILIIQTAFIGDVVLATPLIEKLKQTHKDCTIDFLLRKGNESLLSNNPHINRVLVFNKKEQKFKNLMGIIKEVRAASYDYVINLQRFFTTGLITALSGGKEKIGFDKNPFSFTYNRSVQHHISADGKEHEVVRNLALLEGITDTSYTRPKLYPSDNDYRKVATDKEYVCIAPASEWYTKKFPKEKWCQLIKQIPDKYHIYLIGAPGDVSLCEEIKALSTPERIDIYAGQLSFLESVALIEKAKMTFSNDSAPLHFASAVNAPVTAIFCSTVPGFGFGPLSDTSYLMEVEEPLACRPCGLHGKKACPKQHFKCADISTSKILETAGLV